MPIPSPYSTYAFGSVQILAQDFFEHSLGKGEVESSILSSSTMKPYILLTIAQSRAFGFQSALQNIAGKYAL